MPETPAPARPLRRLLVPGVVSLCAVGAGAWACALEGLPVAVWVRNPAAWLVGGLVACLLQGGGSRMLAGLLPLAAALLGLTFLGSGQEGVHRWLSLGPLSINAAMLVLPAAVVALAFLGGKFAWPWLAALACMALLVVQPDRSQASAFGVAIIWIALRTRLGRAPQLAIVLASALLAAAAWFRLDPLRPVREVEQIFQLALEVSPVLAGAGMLSLLVASGLPAWMMRGAAPPTRMIGEALGLYLLVTSVMPFVGAYPVPLVGVGVSSVLGFWLAIGAVSAARSIGGKGERAADLAT